MEPETEQAPPGAQKVQKIKFTPDEDFHLRTLVSKHGNRDWMLIAESMPDRNPRQCRDRWNNYLGPALRVGPWTDSEDQALIAKQGEIGQKWVSIGQFLGRRGTNSVRQRFQILQRRTAKALATPAPDRPAPESEPESTTPMTVTLSESDKVFRLVFGLGL
jgi:hypothetical protein